MDEHTLTRLVDRYVEVYFFGLKRVTAMIPDPVLDQLTPDQFVVLNFIQKNGPCLTSQVSDYCCVNKGATTAMIDRLVNKGYVQRTLDENDRRIVLLNITEKGKELVHIGYIGAAKLVESVIKKFDQEEVEIFIRVFEKIALLFQQGNEGD